MTQSSPDNRTTQVAIVGGGITGLSLAWYLQRDAHANDLPLTYTLIEASDRWGGKVQTDVVPSETEQPFVIEAGPDSFLTRKPWAVQLAREVGLEDRFMTVNGQMSRIFILSDGEPQPLPDGMALLVPTEFEPFARSTLLSPLGKARMAMDYVIPAKTDDEDETLGDFVRRRLGDEALERIAEPMLSGIYSADVEKQSLLATFPQFRRMEQEHGGLIRAALATRKQLPTNAEPPFITFPNGVQELTDAVAAKLNGDLCLNTRVQSITRTETGYNLSLSDGQTLHADAVVLTVAAPAAASLVRPLLPETANHLDTIRYVGLGTVMFAYRREDITHPMDGFGVMIPRAEKRPVNGLTWITSKWNQRAPDDYALIRVFFGGSRNPQMMSESNESIVATARDQLRELMNLETEPLFHRLYRLDDAYPQYDVGHLDLVDTIEKTLPDDLYLTGSAYRGIGLPDCVKQAQHTAEALLKTVTPR